MVQDQVFIHVAFLCVTQNITDLNNLHGLQDFCYRKRQLCYGYFQVLRAPELPPLDSTYILIIDCVIIMWPNKKFFVGVLRAKAKTGFLYRANY